jgi:hypothetical protein
MVWQSSGENRAARMRGHISVVIARASGSHPDPGWLTGWQVTIQRPKFSFGNRTLTMISVW